MIDGIVPWKQRLMFGERNSHRPATILRPAPGPGVWSYKSSTSRTIATTSVGEQASRAGRSEPNLRAGLAERLLVMVQQGHVARRPLMRSGHDGALQLDRPVVGDVGDEDCHTSSWLGVRARCTRLARHEDPHPPRADGSEPDDSGARPGRSCGSTEPRIADTGPWKNRASSSSIRSGGTTAIGRA